MYSFFIDGTQLPITPQKLTVKIKGNNKMLTLVNESDISFLRLPGLTEISFDMVLPMLGKYSFASAYKKPDYYLSLLENLMLGRKPFQFIVSRMGPSGALLYDSNMKVSLDSYTVTEDATKGPDVTVAVTLKQYKAFSTKTVQVQKTEEKTTVKAETPRETSSAPKTKTYTVKSGDCLWNIAKKYYGNGARYSDIFNVNKDKISNPNLIYPGQVLTIP